MAARRRHAEAAARPRLSRFEAKTKSFATIVHGACRYSEPMLAWNTRASPMRHPTPVFMQAGHHAHNHAFSLPFSVLGRGGMHSTHAQDDMTASAQALPSDDRGMRMNLRQRMLTVLILLPVVLLALVLGGIPMLLLSLAIGMIGVLEFYNLLQRLPAQPVGWMGAVALLGMVAAFAANAFNAALLIASVACASAVVVRLLQGRPPRAALYSGVLTLAGLVYVGLPCGFLIVLRNGADGLAWLMVVVLMTWGADSAAYVAGRLWGRTPLAPHISPGKTREGAIGGYLVGFTCGVLVLLLGDIFSPLALLMCACAPVFAVVGDLLESYMKRVFAAKDSHLRGWNVLPGHGGVLDRIDALIFVSTFCYAFILLAQLQ
jgi:phosphatidate cytidylyltransferase